MDLFCRHCGANVVALMSPECAQCYLDNKVKTCKGCRKKLRHTEFKRNGRSLEPRCFPCARERQVAKQVPCECGGTKWPKAKWCRGCPARPRKPSKHLTEEEKIERQLRKRLRRYNLTPEQFKEMTEEGCHVCGATEKLYIDHDHTCCPGSSQSCGKCVRGVLCNPHNIGEGLFKGNISHMTRMISFLNRGAPKTFPPLDTLPISDEVSRKYRVNKIKKFYRLTLPEYSYLLSIGCEVCGEYSRLSIDHDHSCCPKTPTCGECVRGVLCTHHNRAEGCFNSEAEIYKLIEYVERWNSVSNLNNG